MASIFNDLADGNGLSMIPGPSKFRSTLKSLLRHISVPGMTNHLQFLSAQSTQTSKYQAFWTTTSSLRKQFAELYGGENAVRAMMERGFTFFPLQSSPEKPPSDLVHTACRIRNAKEESRPFKFTFGGYSVTVGRGNYFGQSFPFVMKRLLDAPFQLLGINLSVQNAAIGG